jgi:hypothetical protein
MSELQSDDQPFEESLAQVERSLQDLKERYVQVQADELRQGELRERAAQIGAAAKSPEIQLELRRIEQELETLELNLESRLFSWAGLKEAFWQAVRFGGLGLVVGWSLAFYTLNQTPPQNSAPIERRN